MSRIRADKYTNREGTGAPTFTDGLVVGTGTSIKSPAANTLIFDTNSVERLRINSNGYVDIQTGIFGDNPSDNFTLNGRTQPHYGFNLVPETGVPIGISGYRGIAFASSGTERMRITEGGDMGLGTNSPTSFGPTFQISGTDPALLLQDTATAVDYFGMTIASGAVTTWFDDASALVINTASGISGAGLVERLRITSDGYARLTTANARLEWTASSGSNPFIRSIGSGQQELEFNTGGNERVRITSGGDLSITDGNLKLAAGRGIDFSANSDAGRTVTANVLDDYEEGTWTVAMSNGITLYGTQDLASYVKIGSSVTVFGQIRVNNGNTNANMLINNLPFACASQTENETLAVGSMRLYNAAITGAAVQVVCVTADGTTILYFNEVRDNNSDLPCQATNDGYYMFNITYRTSS